MRYPAVTLSNNVISVGNLEISLKRTIRVPDNEQVNFLPPSLGNFPLYHVKDYADRLPEQMVSKGGLFMPMYQSEALWVSFNVNNVDDQDNHFAVKMFVGGINAVSGEPMLETEDVLQRRRQRLESGESIQDYIVVPYQHWLDGIAHEPGKVRQFVATAAGSGQSIEAQITGQETMNGIQFEITTLAPPPEPVPDYTYLPPRSSDLPPGSLSLFIKTLTGKTISIHYEPDFFISDLKHMIAYQEGVPWDQQRFIFAGKVLEGNQTVASYKIEPHSVIHLVLRLRGGGGPTYHTQRNKEKGAELNIAAGGIIEQKIWADDRFGWDPKKMKAFNIQILNTAHFKYITGLSAPKTPLTAKMYANLGFRFFKMYEEPSNVSGMFDKVKSVGQLTGKTDDPIHPSLKRISNPYASENDSRKAKKENEHSSPQPKQTADDATTVTKVDEVVKGKVQFFNVAGPYSTFRSLKEMKLAIRDKTGSQECKDEVDK